MPLDASRALLAPTLLGDRNGIVQSGGGQRWANGLRCAIGQCYPHLRVERVVPRHGASHFALAGIQDRGESRPVVLRLNSVNLCAPRLVTVCGVEFAQIVAQAQPRERVASVSCW